MGWSFLWEQERSCQPGMCRAGMLAATSINAFMSVSSIGLIYLRSASGDAGWRILSKH